MMWPRRSGLRSVSGSQPECTLESPRGSFETIPVQGPHPNPIKPGAWGRGCGFRIFVYVMFCDSGGRIVKTPSVIPACRL